MCPKDHLLSMEHFIFMPTKGCCRQFISQCLFRFDKMWSSHWPIWSNKKLPLANLFKTKRTPTDELPTEYHDCVLSVQRDHGGQILHFVDFTFEVPPSCPIALAFLPNSNNVKQNLADSRATKGKSTKPSLYLYVQFHINLRVASC